MIQVKESMNDATRQFDIVNLLIKTKWMQVLSDSSIRLLMALYYMYSNEGYIYGNYEKLIAYTGLSKTSVYTALMELEMFNFILNTGEKKGRARLLRFNDNVIYLDDNLTKTFSNSIFRTIVLKITNSIALTEKEDKFKTELIENKTADYSRQYLVKLLYRKENAMDYSFESIVNEGATRVYDETMDINENNWMNIVTDEEKKNKFLMEILECYVVHVNTPTRKDIELIKLVYEQCYPFQIKNAIKIVKNNPKYGDKFREFSYIYKMLTKGMFGTRNNNNAKENFTGRKTKSTKIDNQRKTGWEKSSSMSREEMFDMLQSGENVDFSKLRK